MLSLQIAWRRLNKRIIVDTEPINEGAARVGAQKPMLGHEPLFEQTGRVLEILSGRTYESDCETTVEAGNQVIAQFDTESYGSRWCSTSAVGEVWKLKETRSRMNRQP